MIVKHARKSLLFNDGKPWTKKDSSSLFDVTMGSHDGAEICELVGLFILNNLGQKFGKKISVYTEMKDWQSLKTNQHVWQVKQGKISTNVSSNLV